MADTLVYLAGAALVLWGTAHIAPTKSVAGSFGDIGTENRRIFVMEWIAEGITHIAIGTLVVCIALSEASEAPRSSSIDCRPQCWSRSPS